MAEGQRPRSKMRLSLGPGNGHGVCRGDGRRGNRRRGAPVTGYLQHVRDICDRHGVLLILDEVMCGSGRTGTFLSCEQDGVVPDIVTLGKGLGAGYQPIGAVVCTSDVYETVAQGSGALKHGQTYNAHPAGCAAALAVQRVIQDEGLLGRVGVAGEGLRALLAERFGDHRNVGDDRRRSVGKRATQRPLPDATEQPLIPNDALHG